MRRCGFRPELRCAGSGLRDDLLPADAGKNRVTFGGCPRFESRIRAARNAVNEPAESKSAVISAERLRKRYDQGLVQALDDVSLAVGPAEYVAIMGPSGCGKSTLLNMLGCLDRPDSGEVYIDGQAVSKIRNLARIRARHIGFVFQSFFLLPTLTAWENIQVPMMEGDLRPRERGRKADELLAAVKLSHRARHLPSKLSVGERQRVAVARALANDPLIVLADEPTGNLDSKAAAEVLHLFDQLKTERHVTLVVVTHSQEVADRADRTIHMRDGRIV
jgi:putative ABC transport system ATP-binding protein